jgi:N-acetylglutamate synthase-like GNAT family acetyltransferase
MTPPVFESFKDGFTISTNPDRLDIDVMHDYLANRSYWARGIPRQLLEKSNRNSLCFGVYRGEQQVGFARVISDYATFAYIEDVFILEDHQGQGLGKWLMACIRDHPDLQDLRRWMLLTRDAHGLYAQYGFQPLSRPERHMEISDPSV